MFFSNTPKKVQPEGRRRTEEDRNLISGEGERKRKVLERNSELNCVVRQEADETKGEIIRGHKLSRLSGRRKIAVTEKKRKKRG